MCGIAGFIDKGISYDAPLMIKAMGNAILHRGPDSSGIWSDNSYGVNIVHQRLAILDLSSAGHQPMLSKSGRYVISFNGEIYNWQYIKNDIEDKLGQVNWIGHSDTEVMLLAIEVYGLEDALQKFEGMFAIALWDREKKDLYLIRDRMGEKPLYYGYFNGVFAFSSELKALRKHPKFECKLNKNAIAQLMLHNCIPAPLSIFEDIYKLKAGHYLKLQYEQYSNHELPQSVPYWSLSEHLKQEYNGNENQAVDDLDKLLTRVIGEQVIADVPLGCFLSGGVDSSMIAAKMQSLSTIPIHTFSIGFENKVYNEAHYAKAVASYLGTNHAEVYITDKDALDIIPKLPFIYDEPFSDSSQIPTYLVSKLAKQSVTVSLSGDGGDELFAGYTRHTLAPQIYHKLQKIPGWSKSLLCKSLPLLNKLILTKLNQLLGSRVYNLNDKLQKLENLLRVNDFSGMYLCLTGHWLNSNELVKNTSLNGSLWLNENISTESQMLNLQYLDTMGYLPDDILVKVDRAAMANSLETRVPFLNHKLVEFAYSLPDSYKVNHKQSKWILRQVLYKYIPKELIERPKIGFAIPIHEWLRGPLRDWMLNLLDEKKLKQQGIFNSNLILEKLNAHLSGQNDNGFYLWDILMFQQWLEYWENGIEL